MSTRAPDESDLLCESCGYTLNGLPTTGRCPECGTPIEVNLCRRQPSLWETIGDPRPKWIRFILTTTQVIFRPKKFFRSTTSRGELGPPRRFAQIHWAIASALLGVAAWAHWDSYEWVIYRAWAPPMRIKLLLLLALPLAAYLAITATVHLAARLTAWEAAYRGFRLPHPVVLRALYYHSAHLLPVALLAFITCAGYDLLFRQRFIEPIYTYTVCGEVIVAAAYLFNTYWIGMRNLMYANR